MVQIARLEERQKHPRKLAKIKKLLQRVETLHEFNPMMGHRGVRLGISYPEITELQARAILEAACLVRKKGVRVIPEIMMPLVGHVGEFQNQKAVVDKVAIQVMKEHHYELCQSTPVMMQVLLVN